MQRHIPSRRGFLGLLGAALACPGLVHAASPETLSGFAFGTTWRIVGPPDAHLERLRPGLDALFGSIDAELSPWRSDSVACRFNASATGAEATDEVIHVTRTALRLAAESDGAFDPTVGPLVARWGFGAIEGSEVPDWQGVQVAPGRIVKAGTGLTLDLCGIAKGRALDRAAELARGFGFDHLLLDLGGELGALGCHPSGRAWQVAVEHPLSGPEPAAVLHMPEGMAVATSGLRAQSYALGSRIWGHIIDPASRSPVSGRLRSVTVLAGDAMTADGWATALFAAGDVAGPALARTRDIAALFLFDEESLLRQVTTGGMAQALTLNGARR
ncbi:MAG: FAD:protein FMN transferase [Paracoccaceae bacterium]